MDEILGQGHGSEAKKIHSILITSCCYDLKKFFDDYLNFLIMFSTYHLKTAPL